MNVAFIIHYYLLLEQGVFISHEIVLLWVMSFELIGLSFYKIERVYSWNLY